MKIGDKELNKIFVMSPEGKPIAIIDDEKIIENDGYTVTFSVESEEVEDNDKRIKL